MARIWYSVCGEGMGHAIRSHTIISELEKENDILITAAENAYPYLKSKHKRVHWISGNTLVYRNNRVLWIASFIKFWLGLLYQIPYNIIKIHPLVRKFKPQLVISDFESAAHYMARLYNIPCISVDNNHVLSECKIKTHWIVKPVVRFLHATSDLYLILSFSRVKTTNPKAVLVDPVVRKEIRNAKTSNKDHVLVYQTTPTNKQLLKTLAMTKNKYFVYGMKKKGSYKNMIYKEYSDKGFIQDLASCRFVILNGGFTLISEAIYLRKPILTVPVINQYEQEFNSECIENEGYGMMTKKLTPGDILRFESKLQNYNKNLSTMGKWNTNRLYSLIKKCIHQ